MHLSPIALALKIARPDAKKIVLCCSFLRIIVAIGNSLSSLDLCYG